MCSEIPADRYARDCWLSVGEEENTSSPISPAFIHPKLTYTHPLHLIPIHYAPSGLLNLYSPVNPIVADPPRKLEMRREEIKYIFVQKSVCKRHNPIINFSVSEHMTTVTLKCVWFGYYEMRERERLC